jgi:hypothetical protein
VSLGSSVHGIEVGNPVDLADHLGVDDRRAFQARGFRHDARILARAQVGVATPRRRDCSVYGGWRDQLQIRFGYGGRYPGGSATLTRSTSLSRLLRAALRSRASFFSGWT